MSSIVSLPCCFQKVTPHVFPPFVFLWCALLSRWVPDPLLTVFCCCWEVKHTEKGCALCFLQSRIWPAMGKIGRALKESSISFAAACHFTFLVTAERERTSSVGILAGQHRVGGPESFLSTYTLAHTHTHTQGLETPYLYSSVLRADQCSAFNNTAFLPSHHALCSPAKETNK